MAARADALDARNDLVLQHAALVRSMALRLARRLPSQVDVSELVSVGMLGLIDAAGRYKNSLGVPFDAFARRRVHGAMLDALRDLDWAPRSLRRLRRDVDAAFAMLRREHGREPEEAEIAAAMGLTLEEYEQALEQLRTLDIGQARQVDATREDGSSRLELTIDPSDGPGVQLERRELRDHLARAIQQLPERERQVIALYYDQELTLAEAGAVIGVSESRVSQLRSQAIARLRTQLRESLADREAGR
ncbi:MAG: sigma-70 family RNA polymerase sigma factor [Vicinamibacterales bacterium]